MRGSARRVPVDAAAPIFAPFRTGSYLIRDFNPKGGNAGRYFRKGSDLKTVPFRASGSRQLDKPRLKSTLEEVAKLVAPGGCIYLVDLREESHLFFDDSAVSWYADKDFANVGQPLAWIQADELAQIEKIKKVPTTRVFSIAKDDQHRVTPTRSAEVTVGSGETEEQFATSSHCTTCCRGPDRACPSSLCSKSSRDDSVNSSPTASARRDAASTTTR